MYNTRDKSELLLGCPQLYTIVQELRVDPTRTNLYETLETCLLESLPTLVITQEGRKKHTLEYNGIWANSEALNWIMFDVIPVHQVYLSNRKCFQRPHLSIVLGDMNEKKVPLNIDTDGVHNIEEQDKWKLTYYVEKAGVDEKWVIILSYICHLDYLNELPGKMNLVSRLKEKLTCH
ncbi:hypothetical protein K493DRAFT_300352 [Basidiobolus meristosporus CBS 931.73]|uniref:Uncharacterized protein n=1 Tax=Basidiobolus meristosporus CBS 931.73 TaxID=1314790 RepID=A0A1Y1YHW5_9FUNG|nr:hypothetical protein K493DRAFT_300352 [Basidiobolus meristosporus CBS 931.73]|eukprot:ORX97631.1 hypothetical protein K493DRAFT_300352 [Basidiobolus meristosporus CBS 931.73]